MIDFQNINSGNTWIIKTGDASRNYFDYFKNYGVALAINGYPGKEGETTTKEFYDRNKKVKNWGKKLKSISVGEYILAVKGNNTLLGIGKVLQEYDWSDLFNDVDAWSLNHFIRVEWYVPDTEVKSVSLDNVHFSYPFLYTNGKAEIFDALKKQSFLFKEYAPTYNLDNALSSLSKEISIDALGGKLSELNIYDENNISTIKDLKELKRQAIWYFENDYDFSEAEVRAFLVLPFFKILGWENNQMKLELENADVSLFAKEFYKEDRKKKTCPSIIVEVKKYNNGLAFTDEQVKRYGRVFKETKKFVTTNGYRYIYFEKEGEKLIEKGSFNLRKLRGRNNLRPTLDYFDTITTIIKMSNF